MHQLVRRIVQVPTQVHSASAGNEFDRFRVKRVPIHEPPRKDRLEKLRELRDLLKSGNLSPAQLLNRMEFHPNLNAFEAVSLAEREGKLVVPGVVYDAVLPQTDVKYSSSTGTLVIYEAQGKSFNDSVICNWADRNHSSFSLSFKIPEEHRGRVNCALVIEYPDFTFVKTGENKYEVRPTEGAVVHLVEKFPGCNGLYTINNLIIPRCGNISGPVRYLWRLGVPYVGLLRCGGEYLIAAGRSRASYEVDLVEKPSESLMVALIS